MDEAIQELRCHLPCSQGRANAPSIQAALFESRYRGVPPQLRPGTSHIYQYCDKFFLELVILILTTVKSSNGLAVSIFFNVFSKSLNSPSTLPFVSSALFTACTSKASIALICRATSYVAGLNALKCPSISSTTAVLFKVLR